MNVRLPSWNLLLWLATLSPSVCAQDQVVVKAGKVITVTKGTLENAVILIENGVIREVGQDIEAPWDATVIDASDKVVLPTYVVAHTSGGMSNPNENMANVPYLTVEDAVDPSSQFFEEALRNGVGTLHVIPGNATLLGGRGMIIRPFGRTVEDMAVRTAAGLKVSLDPGRGSRMAKIRKLHRAIAEVREYLADRERREAEFAKEKEAGAVAEDAEFEEIDPKKKPVVDLLAGKATAFFYVPSAAEIAEALRIRDRYGFKAVFVLGPACSKAATRLARLGEPVVLMPELEVWETDPDTDEESMYCSAAELAKLSVPFALGIAESTRGRPTGPTRYPWWQMATCVRNGVDRQMALEALTIVPARILGLEEELGSIEAGKVANLQIVTGDPLQATTWVDTVLLDGEVAYQRSEDPRLRHLFGEAETTEDAR
ncbi:MAG: amidohydrolase family protein [Planctomycetota bacterium]